LWYIFELLKKLFVAFTAHKQLVINLLSLFLFEAVNLSLRKCFGNVLDV